MKHLITTEMKQQQTISPQVYQSLKILQMDLLQLDEYIRDIMLENPVLEESEPGERGVLQSLDSLREPVGWTWEDGMGWQADEHPAPEPRALDTGLSLREHLSSQYDPALTAEELRLLDAIVDFIDDAGYLTAGDAEISEISGFPEEYVGYGVAYLQMLDPLGICARTLTECLCIQLKRLGYRDPALQVMAERYLEDIAAGRYNKIARELGRSPQDVRGLCDIVKSLHPKPGSSFGGEAAAPVFPDIIVTVEAGRVFASLNDRGSMRPQISSYYERLARQDEYGEAAAYLEKKLAQARWIIKAVESRKTTLQSIADSIAQRHAQFFLDAGGALEPMTLRQLAAALELHESTISRAISGKYLQCWRGTFPVKYFFTAAVGDGAAVSRNTAKNRVRALVEAEDKQRPLSDSELAALLETENVRLSRRVIAKYRAELGIPSARLRRQDAGR